MATRYNKGIDLMALFPVAEAISKYASIEVVPIDLIDQWDALAYSEALGRPRAIPPLIFKWKPDHCSGGPQVDPACCDEHDAAYLVGGSREDRADADLQLTRCTGKSKNKFGKVWAPFQWFGTTVFARFWGNDRWGFGWPWGKSEPGVKY